MSEEERYVRVTVTLPASLYDRVKVSTDNVSAFVADALRRRFRNSELVDLLERSAGLMAETFKDLKTDEDIIAYLKRERATWGVSSQ